MVWVGGDRSVAPLILNLGYTRRWSVNATPLPFFPRERTPEPGWKFRKRDNLLPYPHSNPGPYSSEFSRYSYYVTSARLCLVFLFHPCYDSPWRARASSKFQDHTDTPHSVGLLWMSDQPDAETSTWQNTTLTTDKHPYQRWDSNPQSQPASDRRPLGHWDRPVRFKTKTIYVLI